MTRRRAASRAFFLLLLISGVALAEEAANLPRPVESFLGALKASGIEVIFSSSLVPLTLVASVEPDPEDPLKSARAALYENGLELKAIAPGRFVVVKRGGSNTAPPVDEAIPEVTVYASRFAIDGRYLVEPRDIAGPDINAVPGAHDDALRALKTLPGLASNVSARPYIRGSLSEDVLVQYDGITLLDPYHLKNFQSLFSAIDPAAVDRIEVFSSGFPVQCGTRSGGVINVSPPRLDQGYENRISASAISAGVSTLGHSQKWPLEWFGAVRRSTLDMLEPVEDSLGKPQFSDSLGRLRWQTENGAWTVGWLLLDDQLQLGGRDDEEFAAARYRDEYAWVAREHRFNDALTMRTNAVLTAAERERDGALNSPGVATGQVSESQEFDRFELNSAWNYCPSEKSSYTFGAELSISNTEYTYFRETLFDSRIALAFSRPANETLSYEGKPAVVTYAAYAANRRRWADFEAELGLRADAQDFDDMGQHTQVSPRLNLRYDLSGRTKLYASSGRFTQAQHIEEWRLEDAQQRADPSQLSVHSVLGVTHETAGSATLSLEAYNKRWTRVSPYFDNVLNPLSLLPDLAPDRVRIHPKASEATGLELNARVPLAQGLNAWGSLSWSRVADDMGDGDVLRSWDQLLAVSAGVAWEGSRWDVSALGGWHRGWPRTTFAAGQLFELGERNADRWDSYYSLDARAAYTWPMRRGDLSLTLEVTNLTNRSNPCCTVIEGAPGSQSIDLETESWLPVVGNLGFAYRWRNR